MERLRRWLGRFRRPEPWMPNRRWFRVDWRKYNSMDEDGTPSRGWDAGVLVPPDDIPGFVRTHYTEDRRAFVMEFLYSSYLEPRERRQLGPSGVTTIIGKTNGGVWGFEFDLDVPGLDTPEGRRRAVWQPLAAATEASAELDHWDTRWLTPRIVSHILAERNAEVFTAPPDPRPLSWEAQAASESPNEDDRPVTRSEPPAAGRPAPRTQPSAADASTQGGLVRAGSSGAP